MEIYSGVLNQRGGRSGGPQEREREREGGRPGVVTKESKSKTNGEREQDDRVY